MSSTCRFYISSPSFRITFSCGFFFQAEDGIRDAQESRGLGDVYKRQGGVWPSSVCDVEEYFCCPHWSPDFDYSWPRFYRSASRHSSVGTDDIGSASHNLYGL